MIEAKIILDSVNPLGSRITTWLLTYPRFIHSEIMTHRVFSRNSASSRAIPSKKLIEAIRENPAMFEQVGRANKGMTAQEVCTQKEKDFFHTSWIALSGAALDWAQAWSSKIAKQVVNRALEPWMHMTVLVTSTDHNNFFGRRAHPAADPNFMVLAYRMLDLYLKSKPQQLGLGQWHLPGIDPVAAEHISEKEQLVIATALACRASYAAFDDGIDPCDAKRIHDTGVQNKHWSPFEHCAQVIDNNHLFDFWSYPWSNFDSYSNGTCIQSGWGQYRKLFENESGQQEDLQAIMATKPEWIIIPS